MAQYRESLLNDLEDLRRRINKCGPLLQTALGKDWTFTIEEEIERFFRDVVPGSKTRSFESKTGIPFLLLRHGRTLERFDQCLRAIDAASQKTNILRQQIGGVAHFQYASARSCFQPAFPRYSPLSNRQRR